MSSAILTALLALRLTAVGQDEMNRLLADVAHGTRPEVERAIDRIQFLGTPKPLVGGLVRLARGDDPGSQENALYALAVLHPQEAGPTFLELLGAPDAAVRMASCQGLSRVKMPRGAGRQVGARLADEVPAVRRDCAHALSSWEAAGQGPALVKALGKEKDPEARLAELEALGHAPGAASVKALEPHLGARDPSERAAAAKSLAMLGAPSGRKALEAGLSALEPTERAAAVEVVAGLSVPWSTGALESRLDDPSARVVILAARALQARKDPRGVEALILRAERASPDDKMAFESALAELKVTQAQRLDVIQKAGGKK